MPASLPAPGYPQKSAPPGPCEGGSPCAINTNQQASKAADKADEAAKQAKDNAQKLNDALDKLDKVAQAIDLSLLAVINNKLGPQVPGGISGVLGKVSNLVGKTWDFLQIDRVISVISLIGILHNAYFLSSGLTQTLFSAVSNVLHVFGINDKDGNPMDIAHLVKEWTEDLFKKAFGVEAVEGFKKEWTAFNRIYQAASNIFWSVQSIFDSTRSMLDIAINNTGKIGNALRRAGVVFEHAYGNLTEKATARNKYQKTMDDVTDGLMKVQDAVSSVDMVAMDVINIQDQIKQLGDQRKELDESIKSVKGEADKKEAAQKESSQAPKGVENGVTGGV